MAALRFDRLTRRLVAGGLLGSLAAPLGAEQSFAKRRKKRKTKNGTSKRQRCRELKREFCAGRCCPAGRRCEASVCVASCNDPFQCPPDGAADTECGPDGSCFCGGTPGGNAACVGIAFPTDCNDLPVCGAGTPCAEGLVCFTCFCSNQATTPNFRCAPPC